MSKLTLIESKILSLNPGSYQRFCEAYLYKKMNYKNIVSLGSKEGADKTTKGTPDAYVVENDGTYTLIMYGTVERNGVAKIKADIIDAYNSKKTGISQDKINKIICCHVSTNITPGQNEKIINILKDIKIELYGIDTIAYDICNNFQSLGAEFLSITVDSNQISNIDDFISRYDSKVFTSPLNINYIAREEKEELLKRISDNKIVLVAGKPGIGKTKLSLEVCKQYCETNKKTELLCIRNNGNDIYEDIKDYLYGKNEYLLFVDDINEMSQLKSTIDYIFLNKTNIKIIATVRDYALNATKDQIKEYVEPDVFVLNEMTEDKIKELLNSNFDIHNYRYIDKIVKISKGNARIAVMSALYLKEHKIESLNNVIDVFTNYYDDIISKNRLNGKHIKSLFYFSFFGALRIDDETTQKILSELEILNWDIINDLRSFELIDFFDGRAIKICDQNFANYILYKYLIKQKNISIHDLLIYSYPKFCTKFINIINILNDYFCTEDSLSYIIDEIKMVWKEEPYNSDLEFFEHFYNIDRIKTLTIIRDEINKEDSIPFSEDYLTLSQNNNINNKKISILSSFKNGDYESEAIELLLNYLDKRPDLINEFYQALINILGIDELSIERDFECERNIINKIKEKISKADDEKRKIYTNILINLIENYLKITRHISRQNNIPYSITFLTISMPPSKNYLEFRKFLFSTLIELLNDNKNAIYNVLLQYDIYPIDDNSSDILRNDLIYINEKIFLNWENPDFIQAHILRHFYSFYLKGKFNFRTSLSFYEKNDSYLLFLKFNENDDGIYDHDIELFAEKMSKKDFELLFSTLKNLEESKIKVCRYHIQYSLDKLFKKICDNQEDAIGYVFKQYSDYDYPFCSYFFFINAIKSKENLEKIKSILLDKATPTSFFYLKNILELDKMIDKENCKIVSNLLKLQQKNKIKYSVSLNSIIKYAIFDKNIIKEYTLEFISSNVSINYYLTHDIESKEEFDKIISLFDDSKLLEELYVKSIKEHFDYDGKIGTTLILNNNSFFEIIIENLEQFNYNDGKLNSILKNIWQQDNFKHFISIAYNHIEKNTLGYLSLHKLFPHTEGIVYENQISWIDNYIDDNYSNKEKMRNIFAVINQEFPKDKKKLILKLISLDNNIEIFKYCVTSFHSETWSGSRVPIIEKKIEYLEELKMSLPNTLEYLEHKKYINELINTLKNEIKETKIREYIDDFFH